MSIPFENLVEGREYFISHYSDPEHQNIRMYGNHPLRDIPGTLVRKIPRGQGAWGVESVRLKFDAFQHEMELPFEDLEFREQPGGNAAPGVKPGTVLPAEADALPAIPAPEGSPAGSPPIQVAEFDPDEDCVICGERKKNEPRYVGKCGHSMHDKCYEQMVAQGERKCPFCRKTPYGGRKSRRRKTRKSKKRARKTKRRNK
jgi:hypothetical protein